ncbi:hypothetical protein C8D89_107281 [Actinomycetospora cinnamomea]|uniref:Uncharacterized protein n=1 Tax=Actinomycetospora cinnamomea TaxID=663609 RepID=A0A2U1FA98_9PSEU|nr:hypothetical protein C8D89_107281 [Actinomycetospora cinnamomea]
MNRTEPGGPPVSDRDDRTILTHPRQVQRTLDSPSADGVEVGVGAPTRRRADPPTWPWPPETGKLCLALTVTR